MKILYAGSPDCAAKTLLSLLDGGVEISGVLTNPPSARGRHKDLVPTAVGALAKGFGIPVFSPEHLDSSFREEIAPLGFDLLVCFAYGHIFGPKFLSLFKMGGVNVHPSLLPKYRGATPVPAAILNRDVETGVTVQTLALGMDEGEILLQEKIPLNGTETADCLLEKSAEVASGLLKTLIESAKKEGFLLKGRPQTGEASYTKTILHSDAMIDWKEDAKVVDAKIRAYTSEPGSWTRIFGKNSVPDAKEEDAKNLETLKVLKAFPVDDDFFLQNKIQADENIFSLESGTVALFEKHFGIFIKCGRGFLCVTELQRQQKKAMGYKDFMNGFRDFVGFKLC